jgi:hypothetical protein
MDTHSYDELISYTLYTRHLLSFLYLYYDFIEMLSSSNLVSSLPQLDMYTYTNFLLTVRLLVEPHPGSEIFSASKDTSSVETNN